jgi:hypothetical protein
MLIFDGRGRDKFGGPPIFVGIKRSAPFVQSAKEMQCADAETMARVASAESISILA